MPDIAMRPSGVWIFKNITVGRSLQFFLKYLQQQGRGRDHFVIHVLSGAKCFYGYDPHVKINLAFMQVQYLAQPHARVNGRQHDFIQVGGLVVADLF